MKFNSSNTIVYTSLVGENEGLNLQPFIKDSKFRHICITDDENLESNQWEIQKIESLLPMDPHRSQRNFKIRPHLIFPEYKYSFYFDNTIIFKCKVENFLQFISSIFDFEENYPFFILPYHSFRKNLLSEFYECSLSNLDSDLKFYEQLIDYIKTDISVLKSNPYWGGMLLRNHMHEKVIKMSEIWFSNVLKYSRRDQLSLFYASFQSKLKLNGFEIDNHSSAYHKWPITQNDRKSRGKKNVFFKLNRDFFQEINKLMEQEDKEKITFNLEEKLLKHTTILNESNSIKQLEELDSIKASKSWRYLSFLKKLIKKLNTFTLLKYLIFTFSYISESLTSKIRLSDLSKYKSWRLFVDAIQFPSDFLKILVQYKESFGVYPNLLKPKSFNERIQNRKLFNRKLSHTIFADKYKVRNYISSKIGQDFLAELIWSGDHLFEFDNHNKLPRKFVIKTNNGSGTNIICFERSKFDWANANKKIEKWLKNDYSKMYGEWNYRWIKPKVIIEECLIDDSGDIPKDYKFFCFNGKVRFIQVDFDRFSKHTRLLFDVNFKVLKVGLCYPLYNGKVVAPKNLIKMINIAEILSQHEEFIRVDLYDLGNRIVFGELTLYPGAGLEKFSPNNFDLELGKESPK